MDTMGFRCRNAPLDTQIFPGAQAPTHTVTTITAATLYASLCWDMTPTLLLDRAHNLAPALAASTTRATR